MTEFEPATSGLLALLIFFYLINHYDDRAPIYSHPNLEVAKELINKFAIPNNYNFVSIF